MRKVVLFITLTLSLFAQKDLFEVGVYTAFPNSAEIGNNEDRALGVMGSVKLFIDENSAKKPVTYYAGMDLNVNFMQTPVQLDSEVFLIGDYYVDASIDIFDKVRWSLDFGYSLGVATLTTAHGVYICSGIYYKNIGMWAKINYLNYNTSKESFADGFYRLGISYRFESRL